MSAVGVFEVAKILRNACDGSERALTTLARMPVHYR